MCYHRWDDSSAVDDDSESSIVSTHGEVEADIDIPQLLIPDDNSESSIVSTHVAIEDDIEVPQLLIPDTDADVSLEGAVVSIVFMDSYPVVSGTFPGHPYSYVDDMLFEIDDARAAHFISRGHVADLMSRGYLWPQYFATFGQYLWDKYRVCWVRLVHDVRFTNKWIKFFEYVLPVEQFKRFLFKACVFPLLLWE
mmetsp:Transcript_963/g.1207  ORF Transcript_963/g.1207 Transcript_963/m.1207 type:complete len:195 (+) Transcript_963:163-747(+)